MISLGIESSCDETSIAIYSEKDGILASETFSQVDIHSKFGGVIPEVASRNHVAKILPLFNKAITNSGISMKDINIIGVTNTPGLIGALFVGVSFAKGLGYTLKCPVIPIHHLSAHILAAEISNKQLKPPYTALVISGGHTHIFDVDESLNFRLLGRTLDDAVGEAFDKIAKVMKGPYPGGKFIQDLAAIGNKTKIKFPISFKGEVKFSFSGLKTSVINSINNQENSREDIAASFQHTVAKTLLDKTLQAMKESNRSTLVVGGGVACNSEIRRLFNKEKDINVYFPTFNHCTDNGDMIAYAALRFYSERKFIDLSTTAKDIKHEI